MNLKTFEEFTNETGEWDNNDSEMKLWIKELN